MKKFFILYYLVVSYAFPEEGVFLEWKLKENDVLDLNEYHVVESKVDGVTTYRNDKNKISLKVIKCGEKDCELKGKFVTYSVYPQMDSSYKKERDESSQFRIKKNGEYIVSENQFLPNLRSIPSFREKSIKTGDIWKGQGSEVFEFPGKNREVRFDVFYESKGLGEWSYDNRKGKSENIFYQHVLRFSDDLGKSSELPKIFGIATGNIYFNSKLGIPEYKHSEIYYLMIYPNGIVVEEKYIINGLYDHYRSITVADKKEIEKSIKTEINENDHITVKNTNEGITFSINSLLFDYNSSKLKESAKKEIAKIAKILKKYEDKEVQISGHTDSIGGEDFNLKLSTERALEVLKELRDVHQIPQKRLSYQGFGKSKPIDSNESEEGRKKNRRVDVTIIMD